MLDGSPVSRISAFLFHGDQDATPARLPGSQGLSYQGSVVVGLGFVFDDRKAGANPLSLAATLVQTDARNELRIQPYMGGEEVNSSPRLQPHRQIINFGSMSEADARGWPDLMRIVEERVRPTRMTVKRKAHRDRWWQYGDKRPELYARISGMPRVLANSIISQHLAFAFLPSTYVFSHRLEVYPLETYSAFATLQSQAHEWWARFFSSTLEDRLNYSASDCFETFPFPPDWETAPVLEAAGESYYDFRADLMVRNDEGLTKTYNRFHDPDERSPDILKLRELHAEMDRAVLDAYEWDDISTECEFLLDYEDDEDDEPGTRGKKKPWRYRWPDDVHDEVLARLLDLNQKRAAEEKLLGTKPRKPRAPKPKPDAAEKPETQSNLAGLPLFDRSKS